ILLFRNRADIVDSYNASIGFRYKHFKFLFKADNRAHESPDEFAFKEQFGENLSLSRNTFTVTELSAEIRFLYNEKFIRMFGVQVSQGSDKPVVMAKYTKGLKIVNG